MELKYAMFTSKDCGKCKMAKDFIDENNLPVEIKDAEECIDELKEAQIKTIPTFVVYGPKENDRHYYPDFDQVMNCLNFLKEKQEG